MMEVSAARERTIAWTCPNCGHGSPEQRDQAAHLDAHRQLQQFFRSWDDAVATDARADAAAGARRRRRIWGVVVALLAVAMLVVAGLAGRGGAPSPPTAAGAPVPGVDLPRRSAGPTPLADPSPPPPARDAGAPGGAAAAPQATRPPSSAGSVRDVQVAPAEAAPAPPPGAVEAGGPVPASLPAGTARPAPVVQACLLGVCITVH